ncbi:tail fiber assembly protein [Pseudomonas sp. NUPR-001]|uniref:tail fiber assembly protein n=1 Tax=Pseudomonas sp. NUPR-001 TaxID=3416058 RepID=UPI003F983B88
MHAKYGAVGWWQASDEEIATMLPLMKVKDAEQEALTLRRVADAAIAPLQDAVDLEEATTAEADTLKAWKKYRIALIRVPEQPGYPDTIDWPAPPA